MQKNTISVVIICKNAVSTIEKAIRSALTITDDVVVADSGSTDGTIEKIALSPARLVQTEWKGYGNAKNFANTVASNDWILSLDADEYIDEKAIQAIQKLTLTESNVVCTIKRLNYIGKKPIHFGEWSNDIVTRLFNRTNAVWDVSPVHERLITVVPAIKLHLPGTIHHYTSPDIATYRSKLERYAVLMAEKYNSSGKKAYWHKIYLAPVVSFIHNYVLRGGFLDGKEGFQIAMAHSWYVHKKYVLLKVMMNDEL